MAKIAERRAARQEPDPTQMLEYIKVLMARAGSVGAVLNFPPAPPTPVLAAGNGDGGGSESRGGGDDSSTSDVAAAAAVSMAVEWAAHITECDNIVKAAVKDRNRATKKAKSRGKNTQESNGRGESGESGSAAGAPVPSSVNESHAIDAIPSSLSGAALEATDIWVEALRDATCVDWGATPTPTPTPTAAGSKTTAATPAVGTSTSTSTGAVGQLDAVMERLDSTIPVHHLGFVVRSGEQIATTSRMLQLGLVRVCLRAPVKVRYYLSLTFACLITVNARHRVLHVQPGSKGQRRRLHV